jgi:hypothetical protein
VSLQCLPQPLVRATTSSSVIPTLMRSYATRSGDRSSHERNTAQLASVAATSSTPARRRRRVRWPRDGMAGYGQRGS